MSLSDEELHMLVEHLAELHGVTPKKAVTEVVSGEELDDELPAEPPDAASADGAKPKKRRGAAHWAGWSAAMIVMGVLVGGMIIALLKVINGPAEASIKPGQDGLPPKPSPAVAATTDQLVGIAFILTFPHQFDTVENQKPQPAFAEQYRISSKADYRRLISVSVRNSGTDTLDDDPDFKLREIQSDVYKQTRTTIAGETVALMTKSGGQEQTLFWLHQGKLLTIAVTSTDVADNVADFMNQIMANVRWRT